MHEIIAHTPKKVAVFMTFLKAKDVRVGTASALTITFFLIWTWERSFDPHNSCTRPTSFATIQQERSANSSTLKKCIHYWSFKLMFLDQKERVKESLLFGAG